MLDPPPTIAAHLYITDVERRIPLRGDTMVEREANYATDIEAARELRWREVITAFVERYNKNPPPFVDEYAISYVQMLIEKMVLEGLLSAAHRTEMWASVRFVSGGKVTFEIVPSVLESSILVFEDPDHPAPAKYCPWAPWALDTLESRVRSFEVVWRNERGDEFAKALCHLARVKLHKVRRYLAGERVSPMVATILDGVLLNARRARDLFEEIDEDA